MQGLPSHTSTMDEESRYCMQPDKEPYFTRDAEDGRPGWEITHRVDFLGTDIAFMGMSPFSVQVNKTTARANCLPTSIHWLLAAFLNLHAVKWDGDPPAKSTPSPARVLLLDSQPSTTRRHLRAVKRAIHELIAYNAAKLHSLDYRTTLKIAADIPIEEVSSRRLAAHNSCLVHSGTVYATPSVPW